jgi:hypothetical protein
VAFNNSDGLGIVMKNWKTNAEEPYNYKSQIIADTYNNKDLALTLNGNDLVIINTNNKYFHKLCGIDGSKTCSHTEVEAHAEEVEYSILNTSGMSEDEIVGLLSSGGKYHLLEKLSFSTTKTIKITDDLYLCLNGYDIEKVRFISNVSNKAIYITNCQDTVSKVVNDSSEIAFSGNVELFGKNNNILVKSKIISSDYYLQGETVVGKTFKAYSVDFTSYDATSESGYSIVIGAGAGGYVFTLENCNFYEYNGYNHFLLAENRVKVLFNNVTVRNIYNINRSFIECTEGFNDYDSNRVILKGNNKFTDIEFLKAPLSANRGFIEVSGAYFEVASGVSTISECSSLAGGYVIQKQSITNYWWYRLVRQ